MNSLTKFRNFVFQGLLLNTSLESLADIGVEVTQGQDPEKIKKPDISLEDFSLPTRFSAIKMAAVYTAFFCFENAVRELVSARLKEKLKTKWWEEGVSKAKKKKVEKRKAEEEKNKWHAPRSADNISYTDFGDLADIIVTRWADFEDLFPDQDWIKTRLNDLEKSRNVIAHNNTLSERDISRIKLYLEDWLRQVG